jgi:hypothetical protein
LSNKKTPKKLEEERDALRDLDNDLNQFVMYFGNKYPMMMDPHLTRLPLPWPGKLPKTHRP